MTINHSQLTIAYAPCSPPSLVPKHHTAVGFNGNKRFCLAAREGQRRARGVGIVFPFFSILGRKEFVLSRRGSSRAPRGKLSIRCFCAVVVLASLLLRTLFVILPEGSGGKLRSTSFLQGLVEDWGGGRGGGVEAGDDLKNRGSRTKPRFWLAGQKRAEEQGGFFDGKGP